MRRAVQVGTCHAIAPDLRLGDLLIVREAIGADGVSRELGGEAVLSYLESKSICLNITG